MANVKTIHAAKSNASAPSSMGTAYFQVRIFSPISAFRIAIRVWMKSFNSCLVSETTVPIDFSLCTVCPPDSENGPDNQTRDGGASNDLQRPIILDFTSPQAGAIDSVPRLTSPLTRPLPHHASPFCSL